MTLVLSLSDNLEKQLTVEATMQGFSVTDYAQRVLERHLQQRRTNQLQAVALLQSWIDESDPEEQIETGNYLIQALDADRLSDRQLFPPEMEGITW
ncbi:MAG: hypothetical protein KBG20_20615 [Caldilineaceae bacterium]|nr:hypothetical protein [Caldilineaceae bacterium]MBP8108179.1 hypothetical protein [Caldilineaceae bacterium]MBP8125595.1 hypothetical protein [Caldilineaceae bacterium]MBP9074723.1 hypothetical protein [Caldilineaceae bacterium]